LHSQKKSRHHKKRGSKNDQRNAFALRCEFDLYFLYVILYLAMLVGSCVSFVNCSCARGGSPLMGPR